MVKAENMGAAELSLWMITAKSDGQIEETGVSVRGLMGVSVA